MFKSVMKSNHHLVLTILLCIFIVFDIQVPNALADMIDNPIGKLLLPLSLFAYYP